MTAEQIAEMEEHVDDVDYEAAAAAERETRHDVMAHIRTFAASCPIASPIIHLGATSCYVGDNTVSVHCLVVQMLTNSLPPTINFV